MSMERSRNSIGEAVEVIVENAPYEMAIALLG
jgi:hypothetical protein